MGAKTPQSTRNARRNPEVAAAKTKGPRNPEVVAAFKAFSALLKEHLIAGSRPPGQYSDYWTQEAFAESLPGRGVNRSASLRTVQNWLTGDNLPPEATFSKMLRILFGDNKEDRRTDREALRAAYDAADKAKKAADKAHRKAKLDAATCAEPATLAGTLAAVVAPPLSQPVASEIWRGDQSLYPGPDDPSPVRFFVHDGTPEAPNTLNVSLMYGAVSGRLPAAGTLPELRFQLHIQRVQIQPDWRDVQWVQGSINPSGPVTYTTQWNVPLSRTANQPPLDHVSLAQVTSRNAGAVLPLSVRTTFDDVKVTILDSPGELSMKKRRVIEHVLKDVDTSAALARGALKAPGAGQP
jgi:hypothetical protein